MRAKKRRENQMIKKLNIKKKQDCKITTILFPLSSLKRKKCKKNKD